VLLYNKNEENNYNSNIYHKWADS